MQTLRLAVLVVVLFVAGSWFVSIPSVHAVGLINWNGLAGDGKWETGGNWVGGVVPGAANGAVIPNGAFVITISTTQTVDFLVVGSGDTVTCESTCTLTVSTLSVSVLTHGGTFINFGTVHVTEDLLNDGSFTNFGTVTIVDEFVNNGNFIDKCHGTVNITPTSGTGTFTTDPTCPAVGGVVTTVNAFSILAPWITVLGLVGCIGTAVVVAKKR